jgi:hypothetical protein
LRPVQLLTVTRGLCQGGFDRSSATIYMIVALYVVQILSKISQKAVIGCGAASMYLIGPKRVRCNSIAPKRADHNVGPAIEDWSLTIPVIP